MKKLKLLLCACALMLTAGVQAQKDVTSQYITNATLSSLDGWTNVNFNTPASGNGTIKLGNTNYKSYNTTGYAAECYEGWGSVEKSEYSLTQKITLPAGNYTLVNYSFFREGQNYNTDASTSRAYLKAGSNQVLVKTLGSITANGYANSQAEGAVCFDSKMYRNTLDFTIDTDDTEIEIGVYGTFNTEITKSWIILGQFELINNDTEATMDAPFDVTGYITNPGFEYRDMTGWTLSESGAFGTQNNDQSFKTGLYYAEKWQAAASGALTARSMSQTLTDLPAGYYKLTANLGGNGTYIDLNGKTANWTEDKDYTVGYVLAENENLTITAGKTAEGTANWIHFDNFRLQFCGDVAAALSTLCAKVSDYNGVIPTAAYSQLQTDVAAKNQTYTDVDELLQAIDDVQALYDAADLLKPNYAAWLEMKTQADALVDVENNNSEANTTLSDAISAQNTAANAATTAADIATATSTLKAAMVTYAGVADPTSGNRFDLTFMVETPDMTDLWTGAWNVTPAGWATEQEGGNFQVMQNNTVDADDGVHKVFTEYYYLNNNATYANGKFNVYTALTLPVGTYTMKCYAFAKEQNYTSGAANPQVFFYANDTQGSLVNSSKLTEQSISFINESEQEVKIGLKPLTGNTYNWMGIGYVKLYKEYTDNTTYTINTSSVEHATVAVTVDDEAATSAKALKTVTMTFTPEEGYGVSSISATYNDGAVQNLEIANPSTNVYTFQMPAYDVTITAVVSADKTELAGNIATASGINTTANVGAGVFQIPASIASALETALSEARTVNENASATPSEVSAKSSALATAISNFQNAELNAPAADKRYTLTLADRGVLTAISADTDGGFGMPYQSANSNKIQSFTFTKISGNNYKLSFVGNDGDTHYICNGLASGYNAGTKEYGIRTTTIADDALSILVQASETDGVFFMLNTTASNNKLGSNDGDFYTDAKYSNWSIAEASQASVNVTIDKDVKYATRIFPFTPSLPSGVIAYSCEAKGDGDVLTLVEVATPAANTPYILYAENGVSSTNLTGWGTAAADSYTTGWLTGVYTSTTATAGTYVLQNNDGKVGFYQVAEGEKPTIGANRCYLTVSGAASKAFFFDSEALGINAIDALTNGEAEVYNLNGVRLPRLQKGMNIIRMKDGRTQKVMVK